MIWPILAAFFIMAIYASIYKPQPPEEDDL